MLDPNAAITILLRLLHYSDSSPAKPPPELVHRALRCLCHLVATAEGCHHIRQATAALILEPDGLLAHHRFQRDEVLLVLQQLSKLAKTFLSQHGSSSGTGQMLGICVCHSSRVPFAVSGSFSCISCCVTAF